MTVGYPTLLLAVAELLLVLSRRTENHPPGQGGDVTRVRGGEGRALPWPQSEIRAFYAGLGLVLALLSGFIAVASVFWWPTLAAGVLHGAVVVLAALEGVRCRRLQRAFVPDP